MTWMLTIDPGHGRMGLNDWDPGISRGCLIEADLAWQVAQSMDEELGRAGVRRRVLSETRHGEGLAGFQRAEAVPARGTYVGIHFEDIRSCLQGGRVFYGAGEQSRELAIRLAAVVEVWGQQTCQRYPGCKPGLAQYPALKRDDITGVVVSPFSLDGMDAIIYGRRLDQLGRYLGASLASWAIGLNPGIRCYHPTVAERDVKRGPGSKPLSELWRGRPEEPRTNDTSQRLVLRSPVEPTEEYPSPEA